jgi:hypothetical protein
MKIFIASLLMLLSINAFAMSEEEWAHKVWAAREDGGSDAEDIDLGSLKPEHRMQLDAAAQDLADVWYDTILEGDYALDQNASLEVIYIHQYKNSKGELVAYTFGFSHAAYDTGYCDYPEDLTECTYGSITGHGFISTDFKYFMRDDDNVEEFSD